MIDLKTVREFLAGLVRGGPLDGAPHEIPVAYPATSPAAGHQAGRYLLVRDSQGARYQWYCDPILTEPDRALAEIVREHSFSDLSSFAAYVNSRSDGSDPLDDLVCFVGTRLCSTASATVHDDLAPETGGLEVDFPRHPRFERWIYAVRKGHDGVVDLTHHELSDLLLDNREDLEEPMLATHVARFKAAKTIEYDADLGDAASIGVKATWKGQGGKTSELGLPREFGVVIPAYVGAWAPGDEPVHRASFTLRVIPPKEGAEPLFRLTWVNLGDFELQASAALVETVKGALKVPTYAGRFSATHYMLP